jgi:hypothetical protein
MKAIQNGHTARIIMFLFIVLCYALLLNIGGQVPPRSGAPITAKPAPIGGNNQSKPRDGDPLGVAGAKTGGNQEALHPRDNQGPQAIANRNLLEL